MIVFLDSTGEKQPKVVKHTDFSIYTQRQYTVCNVFRHVYLYFFFRLQIWLFPMFPFCTMIFPIQRVPLPFPKYSKEHCHVYIAYFCRYMVRACKSCCSIVCVIRYCHFLAHMVSELDILLSLIILYQFLD